VSMVIDGPCQLKKYCDALAAAFFYVTIARMLYRETVREDTARTSSSRVGRHVFAITIHCRHNQPRVRRREMDQQLTDLGKVVAHNTNKSSGITSSQSRETDAGRLERLVHGLQEQALLRIDSLGLALGDVEELMVKHLDVLGQQVSVQDVARAVIVSIFVVEILCVKAIDLSKDITRFSKKLPEFGRVTCLAWESAPRSYHGDRFGGGRHGARVLVGGLDQLGIVQGEAVILINYRLMGCC
jgi:hypothetical protein